MIKNTKKNITSIIIVLMIFSTMSFAYGESFTTVRYYSPNNTSTTNRYIITTTTNYYNTISQNNLSRYFTTYNTGSNYNRYIVPKTTTTTNNNKPINDNTNTYNPPTTNNTNSNDTDTKTTTPSQDTQFTANAMELEVIRLVNEERKKEGLAPFTHSPELSKVARTKSQDMADKNYFSHTSPTYGDPFAMMKSFGIKYRTAGENIAKGYSSAESVVKGWMNSSGHRANILNPSFNKIGVGYVNANGTTYWTQQFTD